MGLERHPPVPDNEDLPGKLQPPEEGWYDTGDIVAVDQEGFVTIKGRLKRFAKSGGEMVSLTAVETAVQKLYPDAQNAVISVRDEKKGERLVLFTTATAASVADVTAHFKASGLNELSPWQEKIAKRLKQGGDLIALNSDDVERFQALALATIFHSPDSFEGSPRAIIITSSSERALEIKKIFDVFLMRTEITVEMAHDKGNMMKIFNFPVFQALAVVSGLALGMGPAQGLLGQLAL